ncbi:MAG: amino acid--tRNA ligase-related protein [Planctomycetota bacterium]
MAKPPSDTPTEPISTDKLLADRRRKLDRLRDEFQLDPYGSRLDDVTALADARAQYDADADQALKDDPESEDIRPVVRVAGRVMQHRVMGNLIFMQLRDGTGDLQIAVSKKAVGQPHFSIAKATDYGDLVAAQGPLGQTKTGEVTVWAGPSASEPGRVGPADNDNPSPIASGFQFLTKSLALPPGKHHGLTDPETRYRKRYIDLYSNPEVMQTMQKRIAIIDAIRDYLRSKGFLEVETPMLQSIHGGAAARPFKTHHNALDLPLTLRIAPELYLKRLLVGGVHKVFEINRNFRNEGISPRHNPEFTMLEAYEAYGSWQTMADLVEDIVCTVAEKVFGTLTILHRKPEAQESKWDQAVAAVSGSLPRTINLKRPWRRVSMTQLVEEETGWRFQKRKATPSELRSLLSFVEIKTYRNLAREGAKISRVFAAMFKDAETLEDIDRIRPEISDFLDRQANEVRSQIDDYAGAASDELDHLKLKLKRIELVKRGLDRVNDQTALERELDEFSDRFRHMSAAEQLVEVYEKLIEPTLIDPCFVTHVPSVIIPLAKKNANDPYFADVYELAINGVEISPGYSELNDPEVQEANFREQVGDEAEKQQIDEDFLEALRVGMPPAGGMGLGIDRLVMMLTGAESIRDVILFPLMRPQGS